jgi:hypothetical protein
MTHRPAFPLTELLGSDGDAPPGHTWARLIDDLSAVRGLSDDWDGQGADAPPPAVVDYAVTLARAFQAIGLSPADRAIAGANGTVLFEWHRPAGYLEIEVTGPDQAEGRSVPMGSEAAEVFTLSRRP